MNPVRLGRSDLMVSPICLGTMTFGEQVSEADAFAIMDRALERGVNFWDTAEMYAVPARQETYGATERIIGRWFQARPGARQQVVLAHALPMLARGTPVSQVAAASGYASDSAFTAMFRTALGQPPTRFGPGRPQTA